jgi:glycosyltransferase involved in cell wall biosynthesis
LARGDPVKLAIVVPCYNEEEVLETTIGRLTSLLDALIGNGEVSSLSKVCFVNDGSSDNTWNILLERAKENKSILPVNLSRNFGHQAALLAGLSVCEGSFDAYVSIDADLQDNPDIIIEFIKEFNKGNDVVYGVRNDRTTDSFFKKNSAELFYKLMSHLGVDIVFNHADFRLISQKVLKDLLNIKEYNLFLRAMFPVLTSNSSIVYYKREERFAGESKYPLKKMIIFAINGITSFSSYPLRLIFLGGLFMFGVSMLLLAWVLWGWATDKTITGWTSIMTVIMLLGSVQVLSPGVIAEYVGKIYLETKNRPIFVIEEVINKPSV